MPPFTSKLHFTGAAMLALAYVAPTAVAIARLVLDLSDDASLVVNLLLVGVAVGILFVTCFVFVSKAYDLGSTGENFSLLARWPLIRLFILWCLLPTVAVWVSLGLFHEAAANAPETHWAPYFGWLLVVAAVAATAPVVGFWVGKLSRNFSEARPNTGDR